MIGKCRYDGIQFKKLTRLGLFFYLDSSAILNKFSVQSLITATQNLAVNK